MNYQNLKFYARLKVLDCKKYFNTDKGIDEFRVYFPGGSCKSELEILDRGYQTFEIHPMAIKNDFYIRIRKISSLKKQNKNA